MGSEGSWASETLQMRAIEAGQKKIIAETVQVKLGVHLGHRAWQNWESIAFQAT